MYAQVKHHSASARALKRGKRGVSVAIVLANAQHTYMPPLRTARHTPAHTYSHPAAECAHACRTKSHKRICNSTSEDRACGSALHKLSCLMRRRSSHTSSLCAQITRSASLSAHVHHVPYCILGPKRPSLSVCASRATLFRSFSCVLLPARTTHAFRIISRLLTHLHHI